MGAPKQKWTSEEEAALKAGIQKYGTGKWSTILKDPEFCVALHSRSNVDLKDKWRNLNCMANGLGSRHRARVSIKSNQLIVKQDEDSTIHPQVVEKELEIPDATILASSSGISEDAGYRKKISSLEDLILEAIVKLKEPRGSSRPVILHYIEEHYSIPADFEKALATTLKILTENGQLIKVKNQYRITPRSMSLAASRGSQLLLTYGAQKGAPEADYNGNLRLTKANIDNELEKMRSMSAEEVAVAAAQAVAEAEAALAAAEAATREAEEAEAEAEAAQCFADAAEKALKYPTILV